MLQIVFKFFVHHVCFYGVFLYRLAERFLGKQMLPQSTVNDKNLVWLKFGEVAYFAKLS